MIGGTLSARRLDSTLARLLSESASEILAVLDDGVVISDPEGNILSMNPAALRLHGFQALEEAQRPLAAFHSDFALYQFDGTLVSEHSWPLARVLRGETVSCLEVEIRTGNPGRSVYASYSGNLVRSVEGEPEAAILTLRDITEQHRAQRELQEVQRQFNHAQKLDSLGVLAGGVAHDFNNLLTGILGNASMVMDSLPPGDPNRMMIDEIVRAGERAADLTRQLLAYAGKGRFVTRLIHLPQLVAEMRQLLRTSVPKHVHIAHHLAGQLPAMEGDPSQIQQVVMNLMLNAAESIPPSESGTVLLEAHSVFVDPAKFKHFFNAEVLTPGTYVALKVHDSGTGMDEATKHRIFDPFFTTKFTGRGLGLSAVLGIVRGHRGALLVETEPSVGTSFTVLFPAAPHQPEVQQPESPGGSEMVLAVGTCHNELHTLRELGYAVLFCPDFRYAEAILREGKEPAAVVICSGEESGTDYAAAVHRYRPGVRVILSSCLEPHHQIRRFKGQQYSAFAIQDSSVEELDRLIRQSLNFR